MGKRITLTDTRTQFVAMCQMARAAGIDTSRVKMQEGRKSHGIAWRVYESGPNDTGHSDWPYAEQQGFIGMTAAEAHRTLLTMKYVFRGIAEQTGA
jgi:hypothetical protein